MYNNAYISPPQSGIASLVSSPHADSDVMNVKMTPREVAGLQQLAMSYGATEKDLYDPITGQPKFNFLKKLLPTIIGAILPGVPVLGEFAKTIGFGSQALGTAFLVGGATSLIEGDLKKGLMAGLGAYSGANLAQSLQQASMVEAPAVSADEIAKTNRAIDAAKATVGAGPVDSTKVMGSLPDFQAGVVPTVTPPPSAPIAAPPSPDGLDFFKSANAFKGTPTAQDLIAGRVANAANTGIAGILGGAQSLFTSPQSRKVFGEALGGGFESPFAQSLSKQATFMGLADAFTPEYEVPSGSEEEGASVYIPGGVNPMYGYGGEYSYFLPGKYYKKTKKGLVPYNPYAMASGYAQGGAIDAMEEGPLPRQDVMPYPQPNQSYPLSTVVRANYSPAMPRPREVIGGYGPKMNPFTGEEKFADGGPVMGGQVIIPAIKDGVEGYYTDTTRTNFVPRSGVMPRDDAAPPSQGQPPVGVAPPKGPPLVQPTKPLPTEPPVGPPPVTLPPDTPFDPARQRYLDMVNAPPKPPVDTKAVMDYVADLNRRAKSPEFIAFSPFGTTGGTGGDPNKPPPDKPDPDCQAGYTYDRVAGACVPIGSVTNPPPPPPSPPGPPGTTITPPAPPPPPPKKEEPKKDEPKKDEPKKDEPKKDEPKKDVDDDEESLIEKITNFGQQTLINMGLSSINPYLGLAYSAYRMFPKATQNRIKKLFGLKVTDENGNPIPDLTEAEKAEEKAKLEAEIKAAAAKAEASKTQPPPPPPPPSGGGRGGVGLPGGGPGGGRPVGGGPIAGGGRSGRVGVGGGIGAAKYYRNPDGTYEDEDGNPVDENGMPIQDARVAARSGGRIRAMQAGGMTMPRSPLPPPNNPYGAAVGEDFNFGFSGGGSTEYAAAGKLLEGEGDGMSDDIPAVIRGKGVQRAALADGEFVVPADVVSHLGNGSTKAGAKKLYAMMDRIRKARTGETRQAPAVKANKYLPA